MTQDTTTSLGKDLLFQTIVEHMRDFYHNNFHLILQELDKPHLEVFEGSKQELISFLGLLLDSYKADNNEIMAQIDAQIKKHWHSKWIKKLLQNETAIIMTAQAKGFLNCEDIIFTLVYLKQYLADLPQTPAASTDGITRGPDPLGRERNIGELPRGGDKGFTTGGKHNTQGNSKENLHKVDSTKESSVFSRLWSITRFCKQ